MRVNIGRRVHDLFVSIWVVMSGWNESNLFGVRYFVAGLGNCGGMVDTVVLGTTYCAFESRQL